MSIVDNIQSSAAALGAEAQGFLKEVLTLITVGATTIATAQQLLALAQSVTAKGAPEPADWDALHAILDANTAGLNAPLPE